MRPSNAKAWSLPPVFALGAAAAYLPWALKNAWFLGNPFFPLFMDRFDTPPLIRRYAATQFEIHGLPAWEGPVSFIKGVALSVTDLASSGDVGFQLGLIAWAVLLFWPRMRSRLGFFAWLLAAIFAAMALYGSSFLVRWFLPGYAAFTVAAGVVGSELWSRHRRLLSIPAVALALVLSWNWSADYRARLNDRFTAHHPWTVFSASGLEDLRQRMPARAEIERVNAKVPPEGRVLLMPETTFYGGRGLERRFLAGGGPWIEGMEAEELGPEDMRLRLSAAGITHVLYPLRPEGAQASDFERLLGEPLGRTDKHAVSAVRDGSQARNGLDSERPVSRMP
jgi:hypothetical protein